MLIQTTHKEEIFYGKSVETLAQVVQKGGRCPNSGSVHGQAGQDLEHPGPEEDVPAHGRRRNEMNFEVPFQPKLF